MDLTFNLEEMGLNIRVAVILKNENGFLFEKARDGDWIYPAGGRIKLGESSLEAAKREVFEELNINIENLKPRAFIENFFVQKGIMIHEYCFIYEGVDGFKDTLPQDFVAVPVEDFDKYDVRPNIIKEILTQEDKSFRHIIAK